MRFIPIVASQFISDGGAMFGLVPKTIWSKLIKPNKYNGIAQNANIVLFQLPCGSKGLIDTGCGSPQNFSDYERNLHGLETSYSLEQSLASNHTHPDEIKHILFTHLHWDHLGGSLLRHSKDNYALAFPNANYYIHEQEWEDAFSFNPLLYKSYAKNLLSTFKDLASSHIHLVSEDQKVILPGLEMIRTGGHTRGHSIVKLHDMQLGLDAPITSTITSPTWIYASDLIPTQHHLRMVFQTAYDTFPMDTRRWKYECLPTISDKGDALLFPHDTISFAAQIQSHPKKEFVVKETLTI